MCEIKICKASAVDRRGGITTYCNLIKTIIIFNNFLKVNKMKGILGDKLKKASWVSVKVWLAILQTNINHGGYETCTMRLHIKS